MGEESPGIENRETRIVEAEKGETRMENGKGCKKKNNSLFAILISRTI